MAIEGGSVRVVFEGDTAPLRRSTDEAVSELDKVASAAKQTDQALSQALGGNLGQTTIRQFTQYSSGAEKALASVSSSAERAKSSLGGIGSVVKNIGLATLSAGAVTASGALINLAKSGIQSADFLESTRISMSGLIGSVQEGNKAMSIAANFWQNNPFQRIDVTKATQQLVQFGRTTNQLNSDLEILGNVSLSTQTPIDELARYYARVSASGRAMTMDLEMMSDRGIPIYRELEKALGTNTAGVREMASKGKIDFETFRKAMEGAVDPEAMEAFENTLARQRDRLSGSVSILAGQLAGYKIVNDELVISENGLEKAWTRLLKTVATGLRSDDMKEAMEKLGYSLAKVVDVITKLAEPALKALAGVIKWIADNGEMLLPILGGAMAVLFRFGGNLPVIGNAIGMVSNKFGDLFDNVKKFIRLNPLLLTFMTIFGVGFMQALKNSEEFRATLGSILTSLGEILNNLMTAFKGIFEVLDELINSLAGSGVIQGILQGVASALAWIAKALASIPPEMLASLISFFLTLKVLNVNPLYLLIGAVVLLISKLKDLGKVGEFFGSLPEQLATAGHNMMVGLMNGIQEGAAKVLAYMKQLASVIVTSFRNMLGIHSPSTVMYGIGENITLGLAEGIEDSKNAVQVAMNNLAKDILSISEKVIKNKTDFGVLDIVGQYKEWKKVSKMFTEGSEQYTYALEKMEEARKQANLQILNLQESYNKTLDETINKIANMYGLLDDVNEKAGKNSAQILSGLDKQVAKMSEWAEAQEVIANSKLEAGLIEELQAMGVESVSELSAIANMTSDELSLLNESWLKKQEIANKAGVKQMKGLRDDTLDQINKLKRGIDGVTVDVADVGGRLVSNIAEGVYGAMPTLESAFDQLGTYIAKAQKDLAKSGGGSGGAGDAGGGQNEIPVPDTAGDIAKSLQEELQNTFSKVGNMLPFIVVGAAAAAGLWKIAPKIGKMLVSQFMTKTGVGQALTKTMSTVMAKLGSSSAKMAKTASETASGAKSTEVIAKNSTTMGNSMSTASQGMSKVSKALTTIIKGAVALIAIAAAIAALAAALWVAYNLMKDMEFGKFAIMIGEMALAVVAVGVLAAAIGAFVSSGVGTAIMAGGLIAMVAIAADIVLLALALKTAYSAMENIEFGKFAAIIGEMAIAVGSFSLLSGIAGIFAPLIAIGWAAIIAVCNEIVQVSKALNYMYYAIPNDIVGVKAKIRLLQEALAAITGSTIADLIGAIISNWTVENLRRVVENYAEIANQLNKIQGITLNKDKIIANLTIIQSALEKVKAKGNFIFETLQSWADEASANRVEDAGRVIKVYGDIVDTLGKLSNFEVPEGAESGVENMGTFVNTVLEKIQNITTTDNIAAIEQSIGLTQSILNKFTEMIPTIAQQIQDAKFDGGKAIEKIDSIKAIVEAIGKVNPGDDIAAKEDNLRFIQSIINKFTEITPTVQQLMSMQIDRESAITKVADVRRIIWEIGNLSEEFNSGDLGRKEKILDKTQSLVNKLTQIAPTVRQLINQIDYSQDDANKKVSAIRDIIYQIGKINTEDAGSLATKEWVVGMAASIAYKIGEFTQAMKTIQKVDGQMATDALNSMTTVLDNVAGKLDARAVVFENLGVSISKAVAKGISTGQGDVSTAGYNLQNSLWSAIESKMADEYHQGAWMATQFSNGVKSVNLGDAGRAMQTSLWFGIQSKMNDEYYQGRSMGEKFRQGLYDIDYGNAGWWAIQGFINGANNRAYAGNGVYHTGWWIADKFLKGLKDRGEQGSPWKTTMESGKWAIEGLIEGIQSQEEALVEEATTVADQVVDALTIDDISMMPDLDARVSNSSLAPSVGLGEYGNIDNSKGVTINQVNNNYSEVDISRINSALSWELMKA